MTSQSKGGLMTAANYNNPVTRQQHLDLGSSFNGTVVYIKVNGAFGGSGVVINNSRCVLVAAHETEENGAFWNLDTHEYIVGSGTNYLNSPGATVKVSQLIRHPTRTSPDIGTDLAILILESDLPSAKPTSIATITPAVGDILKLVGFGHPGIGKSGGSGLLTPSGEILGGYAPVNAIENGTRIKTRFSTTSSVPLIFNATPGDSGGGLFNSQNQLCGTITNGTTPATSAITLAPLLSLASNFDWIQEVTVLFGRPPELRIEPAGTAMRLTWNAESAGYRLQTSDDLVGWTNLGSVITAPGTYDDPIASRPRQFYRLFKP